MPLLRRDTIAGRLTAGRPVVAAALATEFGVSEDAIRRDLRALAAEGRCRRIYGGALPPSPASAPLADRLIADPARKQALARAAARLVQPGEMLFLDNGSTNLALAATLPASERLTVVTHTPAIAAALAGRPGIQLIVIGGSLTPEIGACIDAGALLALQQMTFDRCFLGACAVSASQGVAAFHFADTVFKKQLIALARQVVVMTTNEKLETRAPHRVAGLGEIGHLVVEHDAPPPALATLAEAGATLLTAGPPPERGA